MVAHNEFRADLYYRLNVFPVMLPALRERREDIAQLVSHFVQVFARRMSKQINHVPKETLDAFTSYPWPGNVRELQNLIERAVICSDNGVLPNPLLADAAPVAIESGFENSAGAMIRADNAALSNSLSSSNANPVVSTTPEGPTLKDFERTLLEIYKIYHKYPYKIFVTPKARFSRKVCFKKLKFFIKINSLTLSGIAIE